MRIVRSPSKTTDWEKLLTHIASRLICGLGLLLAPLLGRAEEAAQKVHVIEQTQCGETIEVVSDTICETGSFYTPNSPPDKAGYRFGYWTGYPTTEDRITGDFWTYPTTPTFTIYGEMTLTAHYVAEDVDSDGDGISDWEEVYWHVEDLEPMSDEDEDGFTLKQELTNGTNPWCKDISKAEGIGYTDTLLIVYNPNRLPTCVIRSNPEGALFDTISNTCVAVGTTVTTPTLDPLTSTFAYWSVNGIRQTDEHGVALKSITFQMPHANVLVIAETEDDDVERQQLFYYGMTLGEDYDTDDDGYAFSKEIEQGTNPHFVDKSIKAGIGYADSGLIAYNPNNLHSYVIRSEPEGILFDTQTGEYVASGTTIMTPTCNPNTSKFAYWSLNGIRQTDAYGVSLQQVTTSVTTQDVELIAITENDEEARLQYFWYGLRLVEDVDTDGDGYYFSQEIAQGTNPQFVNATEDSGIGYVDSGLIAYNPKNLHNYVIRSEPEGVLFDTISAGYIAAGAVVVTPICDAVNTKFAYWTLNGVRQCDVYGVSLASVTATMAGEDIELIAVTIDNEKEQLSAYWFGESRALTEDADGDGYDLVAELAQGTNPRFQDATREDGIGYADSGLVDYNPKNLHSYVVRSDPEGALFETVQLNLVAIGTSIVTPVCDTETTTFAYWTVNGVRQCDAYGVALDSLSLTMGAEDMEIIAVTYADVETRKSLYWYGPKAIVEADSDGDGYNLTDERMQGTSPVFSNATLKAGIGYADSLFIEYNPAALPTCIIRSEPEGVLFATIKQRYIQPGTIITTPAGVADDETFACWKRNDIVQRDAHGRALHELSFAMPKNDVDLVAVSCSNALDRVRLYWYGTKEPLSVDDTDGDGFGLAEEVAAGTSPVFANTVTQGGIVLADTDIFEVNLQPHEKVKGFVIDEEFRELTFGSQIWPVVADVNDDGLWDLIVVSETMTNVFVNIGSKGNPQFSEQSEVSSEELRRVDLTMNSTEKLSEMTLDVEPVGALSATTNGAVMLVSDEEGRIWYYARNAEVVAPYQLQHKVWGGSFAGFAKGLRLAIVDWDDDGDLDCICGTAEGKLMLLRDPKVGRPTGLTAEVGVDNVLLNWEPNGQSRVCGYKVYRATAETMDYGVCGLPALPTWRDYPEVIADYDYKVSALSRFYTAGNSIPTESESVATEPIRVELGKVALRWSDAAGFIGDEIKVDLGVQNSLNLAGEGLSLTINYDATILEPVRVESSGLTTNVVFTQTATDGVWNITATSGEIAAGGGTMFSFVFKGLAETNSTSVTLESVTMQSVRGATVPVIMPTANAQVKVEKFIEPEPTHAQVVITDSVMVKSRESFTVEVSVTGENVDASTLTFDYLFDSSLLTRKGNTFTASDVKSETVTTISLTNVTVRATDGSSAVIDSVGVCSVAITPEAGGESGHVANLSLGSVKGKIGECVNVAVGVKGAFKATVVDLKTWRFTISYDERLLKPVGVVATDGAYEWSATNGILSVVGISGTLDIGTLFSGWKHPLALQFELLTQYAQHSTLLSFETIEMKATNGDKILTPIRESGSVYIEFVRPKEDPSVVVPYSRGDLNGDGRLTQADKQLLAKLMNGMGKKPTAEQLRAGDYNGNGRLDQGDYQLMKDDFKARGIK